MRLEFADERIREFQEGSLHLVNDFDRDGHGFTVSAAVAQSLLQKKHLLDGEQVAIFRVADNQEVVEENALKPDESYPEGFPAADKLIEAGFKRSDLRAMDRDALIAIEGIGPKTADAIIDAITE
jgi:hypothetical protein